MTPAQLQAIRRRYATKPELRYTTGAIDTLWQQCQEDVAVLVGKTDEQDRCMESMESHVKDLWTILEELHSFIGCMDDSLLEYIADYMGDEFPTERLFALMRDVPHKEDHSD